MPFYFQAGLPYYFIFAFASRHKHVVFYLCVKGVQISTFLVNNATYLKSVFFVLFFMNYWLSGFNFALSSFIRLPS